MSHVRQQIRDAFAARVTGLATTLSRVHPSRRYAMQPDQLPALRIYTNDEAIAGVTIGAPATLERDISIVCQAVAQANTDLDDTLDTMVAEVEIAIAADPTLGGLVRACRIESIAIEMSTEGEVPTGAATMVFACRVYTLSNAPGTALT